jgi:hypothetical protein
VLVDLFVGGVVIGIGSMPDLLTGLVMALGLALRAAPLTFAAIAANVRGCWQSIGGCRERCSWPD